MDNKWKKKKSKLSLTQTGKMFKYPKIQKKKEYKISWLAWHLWIWGVFSPSMALGGATPVSTSTLTLRYLRPTNQVGLVGLLTVVQHSEEKTEWSFAIFVTHAWVLFFSGVHSKMQEASSSLWFLEHLPWQKYGWNENNMVTVPEQ